MDSLDSNIVQQSDCQDDRDCVRFTSPLQCFASNNQQNPLHANTDSHHVVNHNNDNSNSSIQNRSDTKPFTQSQLEEFNSKFNQYSQTNIDFNLQIIPKQTHTVTSASDDTNKNSFTTSSLPTQSLIQLSKTTCPVAIHRDDEDILYQIHLRLNQLLCDDWFAQHCVNYFSKQFNSLRQQLKQESRIKSKNSHSSGDDGNRNDHNHQNNTHQQNDFLSLCGQPSVSTTGTRRVSSLGKVKCMDNRCQTVY